MAIEIDTWEYMIQVVEDGSVTFIQRYNNAVDAVSAYNRFVDHGMCRMWREIVLVEPNGTAHSKTFDHPLAPKLQIK
jgi:hypothetical protein